MSRQGISRREVVVILLMLACLTGLLLTGVQRMREAAATASCQNNLKQLGLGFHGYYSATSRLPPLTDQGAGAPTGRGLPSIFRTIAPFLEASARVYFPDRSPPNYYHAHSSVQFSSTLSDGTPWTLHGGDANQVWKPLLDPADLTATGLRDLPMTLPDGTTGYYATGSYAANGLLPWGIKGESETLSEWRSETILFAERPQVCQPSTGDPVYNLWGVGFYSPQMPAFATLTPTELAGLWSTAQIAPAFRVPEVLPGPESEFKVRIGRADAAPQPADFPTPIQFLTYGQPCDSRLPGTPHRSGMQVARTDGSVHVFARDTDPEVFWSACVPSKQDSKK